MDVRALRNYGVSFSDAEGAWPDALKREQKQKGMAIVLGHLGWLERFRFAWTFGREKRRIAALDLSSLRARGFVNERFIAQQTEYADDLVFPQYFAALGVEYARCGTLAQGAKQCDCQFRRMKPNVG